MFALVKRELMQRSGHHDVKLHLYLGEAQREGSAAPFDLSRNKISALGKAGSLRRNGRSLLSAYGPYLYRLASHTAQEAGSELSDVMIPTSHIPLGM